MFPNKRRPREIGFAIHDTVSKIKLIAINTGAITIAGPFVGGAKG
jgi:hypothetical protein